MNVSREKMDDELILLQGLYPDLVINEGNNGASEQVELILELVARIGKVRLKVKIDNRSAYPSKTRPQAVIERGLSIETERYLLNKINLACKEYDGELCLVQLFGTFVSEVDGLVATCGVCLDEVSDDDILVTNPCAHIFHKSTCFAEWALRCKQNRFETVEAEETRTRRRQRESVAEAEFKMSQSKVSQIEADRLRLSTRKTLLTNKIQALGDKGHSNITPTSASSRRASEKTIPEREKADEDLLDVTEAQKRLTSLNKALKDNNSELAAARKIQSNSEASLRAIRETLATETSEEERQSTRRVPCPVCRTELQV